MYTGGGPRALGGGGGMGGWSVVERRLGGGGVSVERARSSVSGEVEWLVPANHAATAGRRHKHRSQRVEISHRRTSSTSARAWVHFRRLGPVRFAPAHVSSGDSVFLFSTSMNNISRHFSSDELRCYEVSRWRVAAQFSWTGVDWFPVRGGKT